MSKKNNKSLIVAIVIFMAMAVFGAAVFSGYLGNESAMPAVEGQIDDMGAGTDEAAADDQARYTLDDEAVSGSDAQSAPFTLDMEKAMAPRGIGNPNAPVHIIEFASLTCSHCAHFHMDVLPDVKEKLINTGDVYLEFQEFPLNAPALDAALLARCLPADRYESFVGLLFKTQEDWTTRPDYITVLKQNAKLAGLSEEGAETCLKSNELRQAIGSRIQAASEKWKISSTPTFVFNDGADFIRGGMPVEEFERVTAKITGAPTEQEASPATEEATPAEEEPVVEEPAAADAPAAEEPAIEEEPAAEASDDANTPESDETPAE